MRQGFVVDAFGKITPQIDAIVLQRGTLSPILLEQASALVPFELFKFAIEVKSRITRDSFNQVKKMAESLASLQCSAFISSPASDQNSTTIGFQKSQPTLLLVAASSELSTDVLEEELEKSIGLTGIIVFDRCLLYKGGHRYLGQSDQDRVIRFFAYMFQHCIDLTRYVSISDELKQAIFKSVQERHQNLDISQPFVQREIIDKIETPSLLAYLYPPNQDGSAI